jgi:hypothetical protein
LSVVIMLGSVVNYVVRVVMLGSVVNYVVRVVMLGRVVNYVVVSRSALLAL